MLELLLEMLPNMRVETLDTPIVFKYGGQEYTAYKACYLDMQIRVLNHPLPVGVKNVRFYLPENWPKRECLIGNDVLTKLGVGSPLVALQRLHAGQTLDAEDAPSNRAHSVRRVTIARTITRRAVLASIGLANGEESAETTTTTDEDTEELTGQEQAAGDIRRTSAQGQEPRVGDYNTTNSRDLLSFLPLREGSDDDELDTATAPPPLAPSNLSAENDPNLLQALEEFVQRAEQALREGCAELNTECDIDGLVRDLREFMKDYGPKAFRVRFYHDDKACTAPDWVDPVKDPDQQPTKKRQHLRPYPKAGIEFMDKHTDELCQAGIFRKVGPLNTPVEAFAISPAILAPKKALPGAEPWRVAFDMRELNDMLQYYNFPVASAEMVTDVLAGAFWFLTIDLFKAFFQVQLAQSTQALYTLQTASGLFRSTRCLMGAKNSSAALAAAVSHVFDPLLKSKQIGAYADDVTGGKPTPAALLQLFKEIVILCAENRLYMNPNKTHLFATKIKFLGKIAEKGAISPDPDMVDGVASMTTPDTVAELMTFKGVANWLSTHVPDLRRLYVPLQDLETELMKPHKRKTKRKAASIRLDQVWTPVHEEAFQEIKKALQTAMANYIPTEGDRICLFTDASRLGWSGVLLAYHKSQENLPADQRDYRVVAWVGGAFTMQERKYSIPELEVLAVVRSCDKLERHLYREDGFALYTDHKNLATTFNLGRTTAADTNHVQAGRVARWASFMSRFNCTVYHIDGERNYLADYASRKRRDIQTPGTEPEYVELEGLNIRAVEDYTFQDARCQALHHEDFDWPEIHEIKQAQETAMADTNTDGGDDHRVLDGDTTINGYEAKIIDGLWCVRGRPRQRAAGEDEELKDWRTWIPRGQATESLRARISVIAHVSLSGHQGQIATYAEVRKKFYWHNMKKQITEFVGSCINCWAAHRPNEFNRPLAATYKATQPFEAVQVDFCKVYDQKRSLTAKQTREHKKAASASPYILIIKCKFSRKTMLVPCSDASSAEAVRGLITWIGQYGLPKILISDGGTHFTGLLMKDLVDALQLDRVLTLARTPNTNGAAETAVGHALRICMALCSEHKVAFEDYERMLPIVEAHMNSKPMQCLGGLSPITVSSGYEPPRPLDQILYKEQIIQVGLQHIDENEAKAMMDALADIQDAAATASDDVADNDRRRKNQQRAPKLNLEIGDYVMERRSTDPVNKLGPKWSGPHQLIDVESTSRYIIKDILSGRERVRHPSKLQRYQDKHCRVSKELRQQAAHDSYQFTVQKIKPGSHAFTEDRKSATVTVVYKGLGNEDDEDYQPDMDIEAAFDEHKSHTLRYIRSQLKKQGTLKVREKAFQDGIDMCEILGIQWEQVRDYALGELETIAPKR